MKIIRLTFEGFEERKEIQYILAGDLVKNLKLAKKQIDEILKKEIK